MKKIICFSLQIASISFMLRAQQSHPANTRIQQNAKVPAATNQASSNKIGASQVVNQRSLVFPIPRKLYIHNNMRNMTLMSESVSRNVMDYKTTRNASAGTSPNSQQKEKIIQAGILGVVTKNIAGRKTGFVLTNKTSGWGSGANFSKSSKLNNTDNSDPSWNCVITAESLTAQSTSFLNASKNEEGLHLYPGAIYTFDDYASGNYRPFENGRNPIDILTDANVGNISLTVQNPNQPSIRGAISNIVNQFTANQGGATSIQQLLYTNDLSEFSIAIAAGGAYDGYSGSDFYDHRDAQQHIYITIDAIKTLYTMSVHHSATGYFASGQMPQTESPLVLVQDVSYGARILANLDIQISSKTDLNKFNFRYDAPTANANFNLDALLHDSTVNYVINSYMVGVPSSTGIIKTFQNFQQQIDYIFSQCNYRTALPISYTLTDMDGNYLGIESMTDHFPVRECIPAQEIFTLQSAYLIIQTGRDGKNDDSKFNLLVFLKNNGGAANYYDGSTGFDNKNIATMPLNFTANSNHPASNYPLTDFSNGGQINLQLDYAIRAGPDIVTRDDWDIMMLKIKFIFVSQKGTILPQEIDIPNFRLSSDHGLNFYFDGGFNLIK